MTGAPGTVAGTTALEIRAAPRPTALREATLNVYVVPLVSPVTVVLVTGVVSVMVRTVVAPMRTRMVDPVMGEPPFDPGVHDRFTAPLVGARVAVTVVGAAGAVRGTAGVTALDDADHGPAPNTLLARTWKVY